MYLRKNGVGICSEEIFTIPENAIIGAGFQTPCSQRELVYRDEVPDAEYTFYGLIDPNHDLIDTNWSNNYNETKWRFARSVYANIKNARYLRIANPVEAWILADGCGKCSLLGFASHLEDPPFPVVRWVT